MMVLQFVFKWALSIRSIAWEHTNEVRLQIQADYRRCERESTIEHDERREKKQQQHSAI